MTNQTVLFVDDDPIVLKSYERSLRQEQEHWTMSFEACPHTAWTRMKQESFDAVVTDVRMPGITGLQLLDRAKSNPVTAEIAFIVVTGESDRGLKRQALDLDAADLLSKPVQLDDLVARLRSVLRTKHLSDEIKKNNELLEQRVQERTAELATSRIDTLWKLSKAAEYRDEETGNHVVRVGSYSRVVAKAMGLDDDYCTTLFLAAPLHDVGKIGVSDSILLKPGQLSEQEWVAMRRHCEMSYSILTDPCKFTQAASSFSSTRFSDSLNIPTVNPVIEMAASIAISHHEKWDGSGYPAGVSKDAIPIEGRIVAIADVYDALRSQRPYKKPLTVHRSLEIISDGAGNHFDPEVVDVFFDIFPEIEEIEHEFNDLVEPACSSELASAAV